MSSYRITSRATQGMQWYIAQLGNARNDPAARARHAWFAALYTDLRRNPPGSIMKRR